MSAENTPNHQRPDANRTTVGDPGSQRAFFTPNGQFWEPATHACSAWSDAMLHGRLLGGLLARELEQRHARPGMHFTRVTVDLFRSARMLPVRVQTAEVRTGYRVVVVDATAENEQGTVARASAVLLRQGAEPTGRIDQTEPWTAPPPEDLGAPIDVGWSVPFDTWMLDANGEQTTVPPGSGPHRMWLRERHPLVHDEELSPFVRVMLAADLSSPLSHAGSSGLEFINADYTLHLSRLPTGSAIGLQASGQQHEHGIAVGRCRVHDVRGPLGFCSTSAVANPR